MPEFKTKEKIYDECVAEGSLKPQKHIDVEKIKANIKISDELLESIKILSLNKSKLCNSIYKLYYDALHALVEAFLRFDGIKSSNHQCLFSYLCVKHPELELDWNFFEKIRTKRNGINYYGKPVDENDLKEIEIQTKVYISTIKKEIENKLKEHKE